MRLIQDFLKRTPLRWIPASLGGLTSIVSGCISPSSWSLGAVGVLHHAHPQHMKRIDALLVERGGYEFPLFS